MPEQMIALSCAQTSVLQQVRTTKRLKKMHNKAGVRQGGKWTCATMETVTGHAMPLSERWNVARSKEPQFDWLKLGFRTFSDGTQKNTNLVE
jgi:hypothetical protein